MKYAPAPGPFAVVKMFGRYYTALPQKYGCAGCVFEGRDQHDCTANPVDCTEIIFKQGKLTKTQRVTLKLTGEFP